MKTFKILYRTSKYGTWQRASIQVPTDIKYVREFCISHLKNLDIPVYQITIEKIVKT